MWRFLSLVPREQDVIDHVIFDGLCRGVLTDAAKRALLSSIDGLKDRGAQGAILGCTEIPLVIGQADRPHFPIVRYNRPARCCGDRNRS